MSERYYAELFKVNGASYHRAMQRWPAARREEFQVALSLLEVRPGATVLDVPAGGGYLEQYLPKSVRYCGKDFSGGFDANQHRVSVCSETMFELEDSSADVVVCLAALHHIEHRDGFYSEVHRVLKPEGSFLIGDVVQNSREDHFLNNFVDRWTSLGHEGDFIDFRRDLKQLEQAGFRAEHSTHRYHWNFDSSDEAVNYFRLLFTLDQNPTNTDVLIEIERLGKKKTSSAFCVNWSLGFIKARPL